MESRGAPSWSAWGTPAGLSEISHLSRAGSGLARLWDRESAEGLFDAVGFLHFSIISTCGGDKHSGSLNISWVCEIMHHKNITIHGGYGSMDGRWLLTDQELIISW